MPRDRRWMEITLLSMSQRVEFDQNRIEGEPDDACVRHTPPGDRSGELWMPGFPPAWGARITKRDPDAKYVEIRR